MSGRQKHKGMKRPRSWHRRYNTPDRAFARAARKLDRAINGLPTVAGTVAAAGEPSAAGTHVPHRDPGSGQDNTGGAG